MTGSEFFIVAAVVYMLPTIVAVKRHHRNALAIAGANILLGWTVLFWCASFIWALTCNVKHAL